MKKYFFILLIIPLFFYTACDEPAPTELVDNDSFEVEILGKDIENEYYTNGYDTSGVPNEILNYSSVISVSGIKITSNGRTDNISSAQVFVFDKSKPFRSPINNVLLGYGTIIPGIIRFDNVVARLSDYRIRFREAGNLIDTVLGKKYELFNLNNRPFFDPFIFKYNANIDFNYNAFLGGQNSNFEITTPKEITGTIKFINHGKQNNPFIEINWDGESVDNFYLILGGIKSANNKAFPFYKIKTNDDGRLIIPDYLLKNIPRNKFNKFAISLVRKYSGVKSLNENELYVVSQSVHTILVDIP
ncbi:MAG: hypothetical protein ROY99_11345 [Ignavibacterium sp.]|jgi:hypothetical protein|nr:hypothetical protein [Ignavibacterium sp.]